MPRLAHTTDTRLRQAKARAKDYRIGCGSQLFLRITPSGNKYWQVRYYRPDGREALHQFGSYPEIALASAKTTAAILLTNLAQAIDPVHARQSHRINAVRSARTFDQCAAECIQAKTPEWKNPKHAQQWTNTLASYASPILGSIAIEQVNVDHVLACLQPIWLSKNETASRLRGRMEAVLDWAKARGLRTGDNPAAWKGGLQSLLAAPSKAQRVVSHPSMPYLQAPAFMQALQLREGVGPRALRLLMLTACRSGEVRLARWREFDGAVWTIPGDRMKAKVEHRVPLSLQAQQLLRSMRHADSRPDDWLFPGAKAKQAISDMTMTMQLERMGLSAFTVHGFRSTFRVWSAEQTQHPREVCEHALAHKLPDKVEAAYMRSDYLDKRSTLMQDWADYLARSG
jgi:integrase